MSERNLSVSQRPTALDQMIGLDHVVQQIESILASGRMPTAWMFSGPTGVGKTTVARILSRLVQCNHLTKLGTDQVLEFGSEASITEINAAEQTGVDAMRELISTSYFYPTNGKYRVFILDEAQKLSEQAQNLLLKAMEDTPASSLWMICTTAPNKIIKALRGRCYHIELPLLNNEGVKALMYATLKKLPPSEFDDKGLLNALVRGEVFSPRSVIMAVEQCINGAEPEAAVSSVMEESRVETIDLCRSVFAGDWTAARAMLAVISPEAVVAVRMALCGYFKAVLLKKPICAQANVCAGIIKDLSETSGYDNKTQFAVLCAHVYMACRAITAARGG